MPKPTKKKILVNVWKPLIARLNKKIDEAFLQRDAYLDRVFGNEAEMLDKEMEQPNSKEARAHLAEHLSLLDRKQVNFALSPETVKAINDVCVCKNVPRDSFINRVLFFLVADNPRIFEKLLGIPIYSYWNHILLDAYESGEQHPPLTPYHLEGSLNVLKDLAFEDPFWTIRACIDAARKEARDAGLPSEGQCEFLHQALISEKFFGDKIKSALGFNCCLPDTWVDGHPAQIELRKQWEDIEEAFGTIDAFEAKKMVRK